MARAKTAASPTTAASGASPSAKPPAVRDDRGRFPKGVSGNPAGKPVGAKNRIVQARQELELAIRENINSQQVQNIVSRLIREAENGSMAAARLILDKVLPNASNSSDEQDVSPAIKITIENATFGAKSTGESPTVRVFEHDTKELT